MLIMIDLSGIYIATAHLHPHSTQAVGTSMDSNLYQEVALIYNLDSYMFIMMRILFYIAVPL